ncbi:L-histidine N(alpha)-methyltransferase [Phaeacidiphilus oryzae]|uniref:L-histidine N(alpha)-methyltransferase n=1 Tax=Phaeacidiphilus oryzae TaxID=348818 RepID=UPI000560F96B|nr:L-histidine N(alpha)-methyltransferase [Phaeacidiphilus oryzae]
MAPSFSLHGRLPADHAARGLRADARAAFGGAPGEPRILPPKWFYDARGSELFEEITRLPEYYPTRAELEILLRHAPETAVRTGARTLVELGSGSSRKTRTLLDALRSNGTLRRYTPLDVSEEALRAAGESVAADYPGLEVAAVLADFTEDALPPEAGAGPGPRLVAFLGSTIGNLDRGQRARLFAALRGTVLGPGDFLLLGADLVKDPEVLVRAYDDAAGVTAEFNKNVLHVLNRELGADLDPEDFDHLALWNAGEERIEMHLRARRALSVKIPALDLSAEFAPGETLRTETSAKFRRQGLAAELAESGLALTEWWTDPGERFALLLAQPIGD